MDSTCPELDDFAAAFGRQCSLAAQALSEQHSREAVRVAFQGHGDNIALVLVAMRQNRVRLNPLLHAATDAVMKVRAETHLSPSNRRLKATATIMSRALQIREAVESEWGHATGQAGTEKWVHLSLPIMNEAEGSA